MALPLARRDSWRLISANAVQSPLASLSSALSVRLFCQVVRSRFHGPFSSQNTCYDYIAKITSLVRRGGSPPSSEPASTKPERPRFRGDSSRSSFAGDIPQAGQTKRTTATPARPHCPCRAGGPPVGAGTTSRPQGKGRPIEEGRHGRLVSNRPKLYAYLSKKEATLTQAQVAAYLAANGRDAGSLLAAFRTTRDPALLAEAGQKYPNDPQVAFEAAMAGDASPENRHAWLDALKQAAPG